MEKEYPITIRNDLGVCIAKKEDLLNSQCTSGIVKFRNIKYASIPYRWASPRLIQGPWDSLANLQEYGPQCPQVEDALFDLEDIPLFGTCNKNSISIRSKAEDEFECLNLNIFAPFPIKSEKLPVLVWIHGGGYCVGSGGTDLYDGTEIVKRSLQLGEPIIVVTLNYRLGVLGFLHSPELVFDSSLQKDIPLEFKSTGNLGILDCYQAITWVKNHIGAFGGDPTRITASGESAGGAILSFMSLVPHLHPKVHQMILSSSTIFSNQLLRSSEAEDCFYSICKEFRIKDHTIAVAQLRNVPVREFINRTKFCLTAFRPMWDGISIPYDPRDALFRVDLWDPMLKRVIFGHCENESWLRYKCLKNPADFNKLLVGRIPDSPFRDTIFNLYQSERIHNWYERSPIFKTLDKLSRSWITLDGHARYYGPPQELSNSFLKSGEDKKVYKYIFCWNTHHWPKDQPATHTADILPLFLHSSLLLNEVNISCTFLDSLISFINGKEISWSEYTIDDSAFNVLEGSGKWKVERMNDGVLGLNEEVLKLWNDIVRNIVALGETGWNEMIR